MFQTLNQNLLTEMFSFLTQICALKNYFYVILSNCDIIPKDNAQKMKKNVYKYCEVGNKESDNLQHWLQMTRIPFHSCETKMKSKRYIA